MGICPQQFISPQRFDSADAGAAGRCGTQPLDIVPGREADPLFKYIQNGEYVYYVHSYYAKNCAASTLATSDYSIPVTGAVRQGLANGILIEDVGRLSHEYSTALRVLEFLQDHGAVLICTQADVRYELYIKGLSQPLQQRAMSKGGIVPW